MTMLTNGAPPTTHLLAVRGDLPAAGREPPGQVEDPHPGVAPDTAEPRLQVVHESGVAIGPPEGRPGQHQVPGPSRDQALELSDRQVVAPRRAIVPTISLEERQHPTPTQHLLHP